MPERRAAIGFFDFSGGVNTAHSPLNLQPNEMEECVNFRITPRGGLEKRKGYRLFHDTGTGLAVLGLAQLDLPSAKYDLIISGDQAFGAPAGGSFSDVTGTHVITYDQDNIYKIIQYNDKLLGTNSVDRGFKWDGVTNLADIGTAIDGGADTIDTFKTIVVHDNQVVIGNVVATLSATPTTLPSRLWVAAAGTEDDWDASTGTPGVVDIDKGNGGEVVGLASVLGYLVVLKDNSLYRIENYNQSTQFVKKVANVGCAGPKAVTTFGSLVMFVDREGELWAYDVRGENEDALTNLTEQKLGDRTTGVFNKARLRTSDLYHWNSRDELYLTLTDGVASQHNTTWVLNLLTKGWWKKETVDKIAMYETFYQTDEAPMMISGGYDGRVHRHEIGSDDLGQGFPAHFITQNLHLGAAEINKLFKMMDLYIATAQDITVDVEHRLNFALTGKVRQISVDV